MGDFHVVKIEGGDVWVGCGVPTGPAPERFIPDDHRDPTVCGECWERFIGVVQRRMI